MKRYSVQFYRIPVGAEFAQNGNAYHKRSTRTAYLPPAQRWFWFSGEEYCEVLADVKAQIEDREACEVLAEAMVRAAAKPARPQPSNMDKQRLRACIEQAAEAACYDPRLDLQKTVEYLAECDYLLDVFAPIYSLEGYLQANARIERKGPQPE